MKEIRIDHIAKAVGATIDQNVRAIKIELFNGVIRDTRFRYGRLRGNWQTSTGSPKTGTIERFDPSGSAAEAEVARNVTKDGIDYLTNNLSYAEVWEERDGMIARNVARISRIVREQQR